MKKTFLFSIIAAMSFSVQAQDTYINLEMTNAQSDVYGTARYVGMGGAMGALGADLSTMAFNPAGIALYRRGDVSFTFGGLWNNTKSNYYSNGAATVDQAGAVFSLPTHTGNFVMGFNFQKKKNFNHAFDTFGNLGGLSQMDQMAELASNGIVSNENLAGFARDEHYIVLDPSDGKYYNPYDQYGFENTRHTWGSLQGFDIDFGLNLNDRAYFGLDFGFDNLEYRSVNRYSEFYEPNNLQKFTEGDYSLNNDVKVAGWGFNMKFGAIVRPFENNSLRLGFAVETPTWYTLRNSTFYSLYDDYNEKETKAYESYLRFKLTTPWKIRASIGSTIGNVFAWDVDYEYAKWSAMSQRYGNGGDNVKDPGMNDHMGKALQGMHLVRAGVEFKPTKGWALRAGYNFASSPNNKSIGFDQYDIARYGSPAMAYSVSTSYMHQKPTHIITLGTGFKYKSFYLDLAYKLRSQKADFYAFDASFAETCLDPVVVERTTHQISATLGFKF